MARINIEDSFYRDPSFMKLIAKLGCEYKALGMCVAAFTLAQRYWIEHKSIPEQFWPEDLNILIETGIAKKSGENRSVYLRGSTDQFRWLEQRIEAGKLGGRPKKVQNEKELENRSVTGRLAGETGSKPGETGSNPLPLPLSLTLTQEEEIKEELDKSNSSTAVVEKNSLLFEPNDENALISSISHETLERWGKLYPDREFLNRELIKAFGYYKNNPRKMPKTKRGWIQALSSWFERGWPKFVRTIKSEKQTESIEWSEIFPERKAQ